MKKITSILVTILLLAAAVSTYAGICDYVPCWPCSQVDSDQDDNWETANCDSTCNGSCQRWVPSVNPAPTCYTCGTTLVTATCANTPGMVASAHQVAICKSGYFGGCGCGDIWITDVPNSGHVCNGPGGTAC